MNLGHFNGVTVRDFPDKVLSSATRTGAHFLGADNPMFGERFKYVHSPVTPDSDFGRELGLERGHTLLVVSKYSPYYKTFEPVHAHFIKDDEGFNWSRHVRPLKDVLGITEDIHGNPL